MKSGLCSVICMASLMGSTSLLAASEYEFMQGSAEDAFELRADRHRAHSTPSEQTLNLERFATAQARNLWWHLGNPIAGMRADDIQVRILDHQSVPLSIMGYGKILLDSSYASRLTPNMLTAALAHELSHLALEHTRKRLELGLNLLADMPELGLERRIRLAMHRAASPVEARLAESEADEFALKWLQRVGVPPESMADALRALRPQVSASLWREELQPRVEALEILTQPQRMASATP